jgi:hypothetical protein
MTGCWTRSVRWPQAALVEGSRQARSLSEYRTLTLAQDAMTTADNGQDA